MSAENRNLILDQFTRQAVPFANSPLVRNDGLLNRMVGTAEAGAVDSVLELPAGPAWSCAPLPKWSGARLASI
jgi:hypothetical protein